MLSKANLTDMSSLPRKQNQMQSQPIEVYKIEPHLNQFTDFEF